MEMRTIFMMVSPVGDGIVPLAALGVNFRSHAIVKYPAPAFVSSFRPC
jgi:hypothetical protein